MWEDPATGTTAGPLGALLVACGVSEFGRIVVEQGTAVGRTSFISVDVGEGTGCISGAVVVTASGCIRVAH
jgi:trans-2,3-dihydro-3-hydroxyanthranilate isomerase